MYIFYISLFITNKVAKLKRYIISF